MKGRLLAWIFPDFVGYLRLAAHYDTLEGEQARSALRRYGIKR